MYNYAIRFEQDTAPGLAVFCRDLPELNSYGDDREHAISEAVDAIETTLSIYVDQRRSIPAASPAESGEETIYLPAVTTAKIHLWNEMMMRGMRKADLCRALGVSQTQGDRLVDFLHATKMEVLEDVLARFGVRLQLSSLRLLDEVEIYELGKHDPIVLTNVWCCMEYTGVEEYTRNQSGWFTLPEVAGIPPIQIEKIIAKRYDFRNGLWLMGVDHRRLGERPHAHQGMINLPVTYYRAAVMGS